MIERGKYRISQVHKNGKFIVEAKKMFGGYAECTRFQNIEEARAFIQRLIDARTPSTFPPEYYP